MDVEVDVERVLADDRRHHRVIGLDQVAGIDHAAAEPARDALGQVGRDLRPVEIELRQVHVGPGGTECRLRLGVIEGVAIKFLTADRPSLLEENLGTVVLVIQPFGVRLGLLKCSFLSVQRGLERTRIDQEEQLVLPHFLTIVEIDALQVSGDPARTSTV